ncbi:Amino-acid acetyltransferase, mitochondrial [Paramarasmius palmivorus]|uniref:Amino-acid acetyltransferase, mitochondrial n=1 Tax=Paramarasmius palmivorus TaxID=297713 RepID=A0AAW0E4T1_9AGAR
MSLSMFSTLPTELVLKTLGHLDGPSLARCRSPYREQTCKSLHKLIDETSSLQYIIELSISLKQDGEHSTLPTVDKLKALRNHQRAWDRLEWKYDSNKSIPMAGGGLWELFGNVLAQQDVEGWLMFRQLPSRYRGIEEREWKVKPDISRVRDFGIDPSQDLLVLIEAPRWWGTNANRSYRFHLRTMSKCTKHPLARESVLMHTQKVPDIQLSYSIQVSGDNLGILFNSVEAGENELIIWDWKTGTKKLHLTGDEIRSFSFLSSHHVILTILALSPSDEFLISLLVVNFPIPEGGEEQTYDSPSLQNNSTSFLLPNLSPDVTPDHEAVRFVVLFIPQETVLSQLASGSGSGDEASEEGNSKGPSQLGWDEWGPKGTRFVPFHPTQAHSLVWECFCYGSRYVVKECSNRTNDSPMILLFDFNQRALRRDTASHSDDNPADLADLEWLPPDVTLAITKPSMTQGIFDGEVETCLGYRVRIASLPPKSEHCTLMCSEDAVIVVNQFVSSASKAAARAQSFRAYATVRNPRSSPPVEVDETPVSSDNDFILSILRANPSLRDSRSYLASFGPRPKHPITEPQQQKLPITPIPESIPATHHQPPTTTSTPQTTTATQLTPSPLIASILNPITHRTALVKIQGPFTDVQLESIARGMVYLEKLGLVSVIVIDNAEKPRGEQNERNEIVEETMRVVSALERQGARARPVLGAVVRLGPKRGEEEEGLEAHTFPEDLIPIRSALKAGEIPVIPPFALDSFCRSVRVDANDVLGALAKGMVEVGMKDPSTQTQDEEVDLTPLRLMIINREGGIPSYARSGLPHLLINLDSEHEHIRETFREEWRSTHPTSLSNLSLARTCLRYMPPTSSAVMVSHRSQSSLIGNLITNKPAVSSSLPHALLQGNRKLTPHTPTLLRKGLPIRVIKTVEGIDKPKMKALLEQSFGRTLDEEAFYARLEKTLDFVIVAGDYVGSAIVTNEGEEKISYLDKFAVLPKHQGDGTVDFLWVALHDESYGLGHPSSVNPNGGKEGRGEGRDLVWRSRGNNPVNKWYFERSSGHVRMGDWVLFWCDAEKRLRIEQGRRGSEGLSFIEKWEEGRLSKWTDVIGKIPSVWK